MRRGFALLISALLAPGSYASAAAVARVVSAPSGLGGFAAAGAGAMPLAAPAAGRPSTALSLPAAPFAQANLSVSVPHNGGAAPAVESAAAHRAAGEYSSVPAARNPSAAPSNAAGRLAPAGDVSFAAADPSPHEIRRGPASDLGRSQAAPFDAARGAGAAAERSIPQNLRAEKLESRLSALAAHSGRDFARASSSAGESAYGIGRENFARITGEAAAHAGAVNAAVPRSAVSGESKSLPRETGLRQAASGGEAAPAPDYKAPQAPAPVPDAARKSQIRTYLLGTAAFKIGMEALSVSVPLLALTVFGSATWAAVLAMGWGSAQIIFSSMAGGLVDRTSPSKVLAWAMRLQAAAIGTLISLFAVDHFLPGLFGFPLAGPYVLFALYSLAGGFMGAAETARQVMAPALVGEHEHGVKRFNAKVHIAYEIAGVAGALLTGLIISQLGLLTALILHPPAYLLAAWIFIRLNIPGRAAAPAAAGPAGRKQWAIVRAAGAVRRAFSDLWTGMRTLASHPVYRWGALALILPVVMHRLLEGILLPVAAKTLLGAPAMSAWLMAASNAGELIGAILLLRALNKDGGEEKFRSHVWVRVAAFGLLGVWVFALYPQLAFLLPLVAFRSLTYAASDLSLRSKLQNALPPSLRGRVFGFIAATAFSLILGASYGLGRMLDAFGAGPVFIGVGVAATLLAALMFYAGLKLRTPEDPPKELPSSKV